MEFIEGGETARNLLRKKNWFICMFFPLAMQVIKIYLQSNPFRVDSQTVGKIPLRSSSDFKHIIPKRVHVKRCNANRWKCPRDWWAGRLGVGAAEVNTKHCMVTGSHGIFLWQRNQGAKVKLKKKFQVQWTSVKFYCALIRHLKFFTWQIH